MDYLITGITGFAGPHLAKLLLSKGHNVHGIVRGTHGREVELLDTLTHVELEEIKFHYLDLKHYYSIRKLLFDVKFDGIFHLAAQSHPPTSFQDPILTFEDNVTSSLNLITAVQEVKKNLLYSIKFMFASTSEVYGDTCKNLGILKTTDKLVPSNPYACSKAAIDLYLQERMRNGFIDGFITRAFSHTGPRRGNRFSISSDAYQIAKMKLGLQEKILQVGNLETERIVIDVRDCVNAYYLLMINEESSGRVFNICGTTVHKMQVFTDTLIYLAKLVGVKQQVNPKFYRKIDIQVQKGDSSDLENLTGWKANRPIIFTLNDLLDYWEYKLK